MSANRKAVDKYQRKYPERIKTYNLKRRAKFYRELAELKSLPCMDCGGTFPPECMDFDHVRGDKSFDFGAGVYSFSLRRVLEEIEKCDLVCANCHRIRTRKRKEPEYASW